MLWYFYALQNDHHDKSSYHLSLHKDITLLLTIFPVVYITSPWLVCFITDSLYFLIPFTYFTQSSTPFPSGNHQFVLDIYDSASVLSDPFFCFFQIPHTSVLWYLSPSVWLISLSMILSRSTHVLANGKISFFFMASLYVLPTQWTWVWVDSGSWWWTGRPEVLQFMGSQRVGHDWATKLYVLHVKVIINRYW